MGLFSSSASKTVQLAPRSKEQKAIEKAQVPIAQGQAKIYGDLIGDTLSQQGLLDAIYNQFYAEQNAANQAFSPEQRAQMEAQQLGSVGELAGTQDDILANIMNMLGQGTGATQEQQQLIGQGADLAIQQGLADLGRFRDEGLEAQRLNSAARGLRPDDTPIMNELAKVNSQANMDAERLVSGIRQQQSNQLLQYPLQAGAFGMDQANMANQIAQSRRGFEATLADQALQNRMGMAQQNRASGLGLATGVNMSGTIGSMVNRQLGASGTTATSNPNLLGSLFGPVSSVMKMIPGMPGGGGGQ
jgi:hypothetical protein